MSKFALLAAGLLAFFAVSDARAAEVIDVSEGYDGIKWGESYDVVLAKLKGKYGESKVGTGPLDVDGYQGKMIAIEKGDISTGYNFIGDRFFYLGRSVNMGFNSGYVREDLNVPDFSKAIRESFKSGADVSLEINVYPEVVDKRLSQVRVILAIKNTKVQAEEVTKLKAGRPKLEKVLLESLLSP